MSTQVVRVEGYNKGSLGTIGRECDRAEGVNHRNADIDVKRSVMNISYKDAPKGFAVEYANIVTSLNAHGKETKKGIAFEGMIITADLPFFERLGYEQGKPLPKEVKTFFDRSYEFAKAQIGYQGTDKNILSAKIHLDEKTPHLHLYYVPVTEKWQTKVYAKGEDGKVLRSERGTPIQAKGADGKTLYEQHEDKTAPKLSRTEFWRVRGGQSSYRLMQDLFQEMVGKEYGLERGEIGSDKKHRTKHQWECKQLTVEKERLASEVKPFRELKTCIAQVDISGKKLPFGVVAIKEKELEVIKEQAKAYTVNRDEIETLRKRSAAVFQQEQCVKQREKQLDNQEQQLRSQAKELVRIQQELQRMYQRQLNLNQLLEKAEKDIEAKRKEIVDLQIKNNCLMEDMDDIKKESFAKINDLTDRLKGAYKSLTSIVKAVGMLKYDNEDGYKIEGITKKQERLIDGIAEYGVKQAEKDGFPKMALDMDTHIGISKGIKEIVEPPVQKLPMRDWDMEL